MYMIPAYLAGSAITITPEATDSNEDYVDYVWQLSLDAATRQSTTVSMMRIMPLNFTTLERGSDAYSAHITVFDGFDSASTSAIINTYLNTLPVAVISFDSTSSPTEVYDSTTAIIRNSFRIYGCRQL